MSWPRVAALVALLAIAASSAACFGTSCSTQPVTYTDADGAITWHVTSCHPRLTVRWHRVPKDGQ